MLDFGGIDIIESLVLITILFSSTMASVIYYKLKNALQQQTINFDGSVIQIGDVKRLVAQKEGLGQEGAAELTLFDPNTNVEYSNDSKVIPRNSHVLVKRAPATKFKPLLASTDETQPVSSLPTVEDANLTNMAAPSIPPIADFGGDFYSEQPTAPVVGEDETKALQNFLQGTATTWQREVRQAAARGRGRGRGRGAIPSDYKCPRLVDDSTIYIVHSHTIHMMLLPCT